jgi:hypothetical protein
MVRGLRPTGGAAELRRPAPEALALDGPVVMERLLEPANRQ